jgi:Ca2+-binding EF-hand superfamily protein
MSAMTEEKRPHRSSIIRAKKSETLEVRIPYETKQAFLTACREDGTTASEVVRESVHTYLDGRERPTPQRTRTLIMKLPQPVRRYAPRIAASAVAAIGLATFAALPSAAAPDFQSVFKKLDANGDGVLTAEEFAGPKDSGDGRDVVVETRIHKSSDGKDGAPPPSGKAPEIKQDAISFWLPDELSKDGAQEQHEYRFVSRREMNVTTDSKSGAGASPTPPAPPATFSMEDMRKREFDTFDKDRDGKVNYGEFLTRQRAMLTRGFEVLDANGDKSLSAEEYAKIVSPPMIKLNADDPDTPNPPEVTISGGPKISPEAIKATFTKLDANKDNKLSLQEYLPPA